MKKKCLHILPMNKLSGAEKLALILCKNLEEYEPIVICGGDTLSNIFKQEGINCYTVDFCKNIIKISRQISNIIIKNNIKIIHAHDNKASVIAYISKFLSHIDVKLISHIHNCYPWLTSTNNNKIIDSILRKKYDYNIACGKLVYDFYEKNTNFINSENTYILSNAIDFNNVVKLNDYEKDKILEKYNINITKKIISFVGRMEEQKGIIPFIENFNKYKGNFDDSIFLLAGSGDQQEQVKQMIEKYRLQKYFKLIDYTNNIEEIYNITDIFFLPSLYEGLPMVLLEAMSYGNAVIAMDVGSIGEIVKDKETGYLVERGNYNLFMNRLIELKDNRNNMEMYSKRAFDFIKKNYNIKDYTREMEKIYNKLA